MFLRNKSLLASASVAALLALGAPVHAQGIKDLRRTSPIDLMPAPAEENAPRPVPREMPQETLRDDETIGVPVVSEPASGAAEEPDDLPITLQPDAPITVMPATNISLDTLGVYDQKSGGVGFDVWEGSNHARVRSLLENVPHTIPSPTVRKLVARLLLSSTRPPESENIQQNVFRQRVTTLLHIDELAQAQRLVEMIPQNLRTERTAHLEYTAHLLKGDHEWVCSNIGTALQKYSGEAGYWQKLSIFCNALDKDVAKAQLALDLLAEQQVEIDPGFVGLVEVMLGRQSKIETRFKTPLSLDDAAIIAISGKDAFPENYLKTAPLPVARLVKNNAEFADYIKDEAEKRLQGAIALEQPKPERVKMREWFARFFAKSPEDAVDYDREVKAMQEMAGTANTRRNYRFYAMLQALTFSNISADKPWVDATFKDTGRILVSPALRSEMASAVDQELKGESILLLGMAAGQVDDLADVDDASIADMVQALMQLGYTEEAQALAAEAMTSLY